MPQTDGLRTLMRTESLTRQDWLTLLEARRTLIKPLLDSAPIEKLGLQKLGDVPCLRSEGAGHVHAIRSDSPRCAMSLGWQVATAKHEAGVLTLEELGIQEWNNVLDTPGIFGIQPYDHVIRHTGTGYQPVPHTGYVSCPDGTIKLWGLTRTAHWVVITVHFKGEAGYKDRGYERAVDLVISPGNAVQALDNTGTLPCTMLDTLRDFVLDVRLRRQQNLADIDAVAHTLLLEEQMLRMLEKDGT